MARVTRPSTTDAPAPEITGSAGAVPPPDAPRDVATGADTPANVAFAPPPPETIGALSQEHVRADGAPSPAIDPSNIGLSAVELAAKHERELAPLRPPTGPPLTREQAVRMGISPAATDLERQWASEGTRGSGHGPVLTVPPPPVEGGTLGQVAQATGVPLPPPPPGFQYVDVPGHGALLSPVGSSAPPVITIPPPAPGPETIAPIDLSRHPAASNSDSPSRGIPTRADDPGKVITGGFGTPESMYFPLDGSELRTLARVLADQLLDRLADDLRFHMSATYPRVGVVLELRVDGYPDDQGFAVAETKVVSQVSRREVDSDGAGGQILLAPDSFRAEAGLAAPRKQSVGTGAGRQIVDTVESHHGISGNAAALTRGGR